MGFFITGSVYVAGMPLPGTDLNSPAAFYFTDQPDESVEIFPNPVTEGRFTVSTDKNIQVVQVMNITGKIVYNQEYQPNTTTVVVEMKDVENGVYLVRIGFTDKTVHTQKIMVK